MGKIVETNDIEFLGDTNVLKATKSINVTNITTADATDLASALILINELKAKLNAKLQADRDSGQQSTI